MRMAKARGSADLRGELAEAANAADAARQALLHAARQWRPVTTAARGPALPLAVAARDLALWTCSIAYDDPAWTPSQGPSRATRQPANLAPGPGDLANVVDAARHVSDTLGRLAAARGSRSLPLAGRVDCWSSRAACLTDTTCRTGTRPPGHPGQANDGGVPGRRERQRPGCRSHRCTGHGGSFPFLESPSRPSCCPKR